MTTNSTQHSTKFPFYNTLTQRFQNSSKSPRLKLLDFLDKSSSTMPQKQIRRRSLERIMYIH